MASTKLPSFQFYPGDWMKDPELRAVSIAARGLWIDLLCLMWESPIRGVLLSASRKPFSAEHIARMSGCSVEEAGSLIGELKSVGVCSLRKDGSMFSRRMVREEEERSKTRQKMQDWRRKSNPANKNVTEKETKVLPRCDLTSSSSSSSSSSEERTPPTPSLPDPPPEVVEIAERIWRRHPERRRGTQDEAVRDLLVALDSAVHPDRLAAGIDRRHKGWCESSDWSDEGGKFAPGLTKWLTKGGCMREPPKQKSDGYISVHDLPGRNGGSR